MFNWPVDLPVSPPCPITLFLFHGSNYVLFPALTSVLSMELISGNMFRDGVDLKAESSKERGPDDPRLSSNTLRFTVDSGRWSVIRAAPVISGVIWWSQSSRESVYGFG